MAGGESAAPKRYQLIGVLEAAVQAQGELLQADLSSLAELAVDPGEDLEEVEAQHEDEELGDDGDRMVMRAVFEVVMLG